MEDPVLTILNLLTANWDNTNTSIAYDPEIHSGWHRSESTSPQVTVTTPNEGPVMRGDTPFSGIRPDGSGPTQEFMGTLKVDCWSDRDVESAVNPKKLTYEMSEEVNRILKDNVLTPTDLWYIGPGQRRFQVDTSVDPTSFRYEITVHYGYYATP